MLYRQLGAIVAGSGFFLACGGCAQLPSTAMLDWVAAPLAAFSNDKDQSTSEPQASPDKSLPPLGIISASARCTISDNGKVDCHEAAILACKAKGYGTGKPVDTTSINSCHVTTLAHLQSGDGKACRIKYQLSTALCWSTSE